MPANLSDPPWQAMAESCIRVDGPKWSCSVCNSAGGNWDYKKHARGPRHQRNVAKAAPPASADPPLGGAVQFLPLPPLPPLSSPPTGQSSAATPAATAAQTLASLSLG